MTLDLNDIFTPSKSFLKAVGGTIDKKIITDIHSYDSIDLLRLEKRDIIEYVEKSTIDLTDSTLKMIEDSLKNPLPQNHIPYEYGRILDVISEMMFNSYVHSPAETGLHIKSFYGQNFGFGLFDGGSFYKQDWVKKSIEKRKNILPNKHPSELNFSGSGTNYGMSNLYKFSDYLEVDTTKGVLYLTVARGV